MLGYRVQRMLAGDPKHHGAFINDLIVVENHGSDELLFVAGAGTHQRDPGTGDAIHALEELLQVAKH